MQLTGPSYRGHHRHNSLCSAAPLSLVIEDELESEIGRLWHHEPWICVSKPRHNVVFRTPDM